MGAAEELVDLVDGRDRVVGRATRREVRERRLPHRAAAVLCRRSGGEIYVHRRTAGKDVWPGRYDMLVGGVVGAGERYREAAVRELAEELGVAGAPLRFLFRHCYRGADNPNWTALFEVVWDGPVTPQAAEIAWGAFLPLPELLGQLAVWPFVPDSLEMFERWLARAHS